MGDQIRLKRIYYISSGNLLSSTASSFNVELQIPDYEPYNRITVLQANIPVSYYLVQVGYNTFTLREGARTALISLVPGNYNINSFCLAIVGLLNAASPGGLVYTASYDSAYSSVQTGRTVFTVNTSTVDVSFAFDPLNPVNEQFGFDNGFVAAFAPSGPGVSTLVSANVVNFVPENSLYIHCNLVNSGYDDILQEIFSGNNVPFSNITYDNPEPLVNSKALTSNRNKNASISVTNELGNPIFLNGVNMSLTIMLYKDNDFYSKATEYMRYQLQKEARVGRGREEEREEDRE